ncbi:MAG: hypothetical protein KF842_03145 [Caulobacter sp.]|nr:hypothetical protein [Caulobacter sp.]
MKSRAILAALAVVLLPASAMAQPTDVSGVNVDAAKASKAKRLDPNRTICRRMDNPGSRTPGKKVCQTKAEWDAQAASAKDELDGIQRRSLSSTVNSG